MCQFRAFGRDSNWARGATDLRRRTRKGGVMPQKAWSNKRERQYEHIKDSEKERARSGEAKESSRLSRKDMSSGRRGGQRSGTSRPKGRTKEQLYNEARRMNVPGRSKMNKGQLQRAVDRRK